MQVGAAGEICIKQNRCKCVMINCGKLPESKECLYTRVLDEVQLTLSGLEHLSTESMESEK